MSRSVLLAHNCVNGCRRHEKRKLCISKTSLPPDSLIIIYKYSTEHDITAVRNYRCQMGIKNLLARQQWDAYAESYRQFHGYFSNTMNSGFIERKHFIETQSATVEKFAKKEIIQ